MKAQVDSSSRGWKDFIYREEKRKAAYRGMQGDPETGGPMGFYNPFLYCLSWEGKETS
jgi:hypothetical protein